MKPAANEIQIELRIRYKGRLNTRALLNSISPIEHALYLSDRRDVESAGSALELPSMVVDASIERLRKYRNARLAVDEVSSGSIVLSGVVAAVALFVLKATLGEAFKEAVRESEPFQALRKYFKSQIDEKARFIANQLASVGRKRKLRMQVEHRPRSKEEPNRITVEMDATSDEFQSLESLGEALSDSPDEHGRGDSI